MCMSKDRKLHLPSCPHSCSGNKDNKLTHYGIQKSVSATMISDGGGGLGQRLQIPASVLGLCLTMTDKVSIPPGGCLLPSFCHITLLLISSIVNYSESRQFLPSCKVKNTKCRGRLRQENSKSKARVDFLTRPPHK